MRALIVGGGVAGLALAAELRRQGREPVVAEKASAYGEHGYSLALYPFGSAVLHGLGAYDDFVAASTEMRTYELADHGGEVIQSVDFGELLADYGPSYCTTHAALVEILRRACGDGVEGGGAGAQSDGGEHGRAAENCVGLGGPRCKRTAGGEAKQTLVGEADAELGRVGSGDDEGISGP